MCFDEFTSSNSPWFSSWLACLSSTATSGSSNGSIYRFSSIAMSTLVTSPIILGCTYLLVADQKNLNEDAQVLLFFFGIPLFVVCSFLATMLVYSRLYHQAWRRRTYITSALLAFIVAVPLEWFFIYISSHLSTIPDSLDLWIITLGTYLLAIPITWIVFIPILRHRHNDMFIW